MNPVAPVDQPFLENWVYERFKQAVNASPNGMMIIGGDGRVSLVNTQAERMFGYAPGSLLDQQIDLLVPQAHRCSHSAHRQHYASEPTSRRMGAGRDLFGQRRDGTLFPVEIGLNRITTGEGMGTLCVVTDITARKQVETQVAVSEERFRTMADNFVDLVVELDADLNRTWVSPSSIDIFGMAPETLVGTTPSDNVHPDDLADVEARMHAVVTGADRDRFTARFLHADGRWIWLAVSLRLIRSRANGPPSILAVSRDITREREIEQALMASEATFRGVMEGASVGIALEDTDGHWTTVNPALSTILGYAHPDLVGVSAQTLFHADDVHLDDDDRARLLAGAISSYQVEKRCVLRSGGLIWTQQSISLDRGTSGSLTHLILLIQDVTERRQIERMKSEFISMVSHELRTPLTSIRGALGLVLGTMSKDLPERVVQLIDIAQRNSERLIPLVNDILDFDRLEDGKLRIDAVETDVYRLVGQAIEAMRSFADRFGVSFRTSAPISTPALLDEGRFLQVVTNLLSNATKFSPGSLVEVDVTARDGRVRVSVRDHGPGIADDFRKRIFGRFAQADSATTRAKGGSGLGLHISRQLTELMGGRIDYESAAGAGSTFWVDFPLLAGAARLPPPHPIDARRPSRQVALFASDATVSEFLSKAVARASLVPLVPKSPGALSDDDLSTRFVLVIEGGFAASAAGELLHKRLEGLGKLRPPVILVGAPQRLKQKWKATHALPLSPQTSDKIVRRLKAMMLAARLSLPRILYVGTDLDFAARYALDLDGYAQVTTLARAALARAALDTESFELVIIDGALADADRLSVLAPYLKHLDVPFVVLSDSDPEAAGEEAFAVISKARMCESQVATTGVRVLARESKLRSETRDAAQA